MNRKSRPHHDLASIKEKFATVEGLEITTAAKRTVRALGYGLQDVVEAVQDLTPGDFRGSTAAHSPPVPGVWHDTYWMRWDGLHLYIKFAGATIVDVVLVSFKEKDP